MTMEYTKDNAPSSRTAGKRRGGVVPEAKASGAEVSAPSPSSSSSYGTRPFPPCTAGGGIQGSASARTLERVEDGSGGIRLGPEVVLLPAGMRASTVPGTVATGGNVGMDSGGSQGRKGGKVEGSSKGSGKGGERQGGKEGKEKRMEWSDGGGKEGDEGEDEEWGGLASGLGNVSRPLDETPDQKRKFLEELGALIWSEGISPGSSLYREKIMARMEERLDKLIKSAKLYGVQLVESMESTRSEELEKELAKEKKRRKELEKGVSMSGEKVREGEGKNEWMSIIEECERRRMNERVEEWRAERGKMEGEMRRVLEEWERRKGEKNREEIRKVMERVLMKRDDRIREEMREWIWMGEEGEGGIRDRVRKDLEEILERRENRARKEDREGVKKMLKEWGREMEEAKEARAHGEGNTEGGRKQVGKRRLESTGNKVRELPEERGDSGFPPLRAHVVVRGGPGRSYSEALREARAKVSLEGMGVRDLEVREGRDCLVLSMGGEGSRAAAVNLAREIRGAAGDGITVSCPCRMVEVEVAGFDPSASADEVRGALARGCGSSVEGVAIGKIGRTRGGRARCWARIPQDGLHRLCAGVEIGWTKGHVHRLENRPVQCLRCLGFGHTGRWCREGGIAVPTPGCFRCSAPGHVAARCSAPPRCLACEVRGWPTGHRMGGPQCRRLREGHPGEEDRARQEEETSGHGQRKRAAETDGESPQGRTSITPRRPAKKKGKHSPGGDIRGEEGIDGGPPEEGTDPREETEATEAEGGPAETPGGGTESRASTGSMNETGEELYFSPMPRRMPLRPVERPGTPGEPGD